MDARLILSSTLLVATVGSTSTATAELSPRLRMIARGQLAPKDLPTPGVTEALVSVRVPGGAETLRSLGLSATPLSSSVASAALSPAAMRFLMKAHPEAHVEESRPLRPMMDQAGPLVGATAARAATGITGRGALVGVVDTGLDFRHADFRHADGSTRVQLLLDLRTPPDDRHKKLGNRGGAIWLHQEIDKVLAAEASGAQPPLDIPEVDTNGHGTHVTGIAAGNGLATDRGFPSGRYVGIAPEADLLAAQSGNAAGSISEDGVLSACDLFVNYARSLGRPLVVNLSLGGGGGAHDGSTNLETALDEIFPRDQSGLALVVAAGNAGANDTHAGGWALDGEGTVTIQMLGVGSPAFLDLFYRGDVDIAVETPDGHRSDFVPAGGCADPVFDGEGVAKLDNAADDAGGTCGPTASTSTGLRSAGISIQPMARPLTKPTGPPEWKIVLRGRSARYDLWASDPLNGGAHFTVGVSPDDHLVVPATAHSAIAVGAMVTRNAWPTVADRIETTAGGTEPLNGPASFSSAGPSADGRFLPDVAAPGSSVISAMSRDATPTAMKSTIFSGSPADARIADDGLHGVLQGTSQAAPMVTGAIALLFAADPTLTSDQVREILRVTAAPVDGTAGWSPRVGFGRLDVGRALDYVRGVRGFVASPGQSRVGVVRDQLPPMTEETTTVTVTPRDEQGRPLGPGHQVTIDLSAGQPTGGIVDVGEGRYERTFVAHAPRGGVGVVSATVDGVTLDAHPSVYFVASRDEIGGNFAAGGGGCAAAPPQAGSNVSTSLRSALAIALAGLLWFAAARARRRRRAKEGV